MTKALPEAILWDLDGTLVDTEPLWIAAEGDLVASYGGTWTHEDAMALVGQSLDYSAPVLIARGVRLSPGEVIDHLVERVNSQVEADGPQWRPGAVELVTAAAAAGIPQAIVTMSFKVQADLIAALLPAGAITTVVSGDMVTRGKPHPEAYLRAAEALGVEITRCLAVEDSPTGAAAAVASGAVTIAVPHVVEVPAELDAVRLGSLADVSLEDLLALVAARLGDTP